MLRQPSRLLMVLSFVALSAALSATLVPAGASERQVALAKKCRKGQKKVNGKCKSTGPKLGGYSGNSFIKKFNVIKGGVEMDIRIPHPNKKCAPSGNIVEILEEENAIPIKGSKFSLSTNEGDDVGSEATTIKGKFTNSKTAEGTVQKKVTYDGEVCDSGSLNFKVKKK